ncbi:hypothetical protein M758_1G276300 [Ceratodon purpureus]|nr:hypothetical protein M758_1G276300 [Ceratodon purpureus]
MVNTRIGECSTTRTIDQILHEASPREARLIEHRLQQEIEELLNRAEEERHEYHSPEHPPATRRHINHTEEEMRRGMIDTPYTREDLPVILERARNTPNFQGLTALEVYAQTAQHLSEDNFRTWMANGRRFFNLGRRHPG